MKSKQLAWLVALCIMMMSLGGCHTVGSSSGTDSGEDEAFSLSTGLTEGGFFEGVSAKDYVTLPQCKGVTVSATLLEISDEDVQEQIDYLLENYATYEQLTDRAIADGDTVNIDYVGTIDGEEFSGGSTQGMGDDVTIGVTNFIDDFLEQLIGHRPGDVFDVEVTFPEDYGQEDLNGKDAVFKVTINYIKGEKIEAELNDDIAADYGFSTKEELTTDIQKWLLSIQKEDYVDTLLSEATCSEIPESVLDYVIHSDIAYYQDYAAANNMDLDTFISSYLGYETKGAYIEASMDAYRSAAAKYLAYQAVAETYGLSVSDEMITENRYDNYVEQYGKPYIKFCILQETVVPDYIFDNAIVE